MTNEEAKIKLKSLFPGENSFAEFSTMSVPDNNNHFYMVSDGINIFGTGDSWESAFADAERRKKP